MLKTRHGKLVEKIKVELNETKPNIDIILSHIYQYEKDNLDTINKLKREKVLDVKRINGAIKQFLNAHPTLTKMLIGSLTKRIYGVLLTDKKNNNKIQQFGKWLFKI
jgi:hypothetical protein